MAKGKRSEVDNLKKVMTKIERQIKQEQAASHRKDEDIYKNTVLKSKINAAHNSKKISVDSYKNKPSQKMSKYQRSELAN